ncbi:hypothetical protein FB451DRAFT_1370458 [Mycena latifolia]|nr:hypothetical protein FB451DRAFT_1370458 [Mycena latifolia]
MPNPGPADDHEEDHELLQPINLTATRDELLESLKSCQLYAMQLLAENRNLQLKNAELLAASSKKRRKGGQEDMLGYKSEIVRWAKYFLLTEALFVDIMVFGLNPGLPDPSTAPHDKFSSDAAYTRGLTTALYKHIPDKFHSLVNAQAYGDFAKDFIHEHSEGRSSLLNTIRKQLPIILKGYNIDADILVSAAADRSKSDTLTRLLCFPQKKATLYAPVLFTGTTQNMTECFTGPIVMKVHRLMLFGPTSLVQGNKPASNSNGMKLGIRSITPMSVSAAATLTRFVLSPDKEWASKGAISGTDWEADCRAYHKLLETNSHLPHVKRIFKLIHNFVFTGVTMPSTTAHTSADDSDVEDDIADAMRRFELGTDQTNNSGDDGPAAGSAATPAPEDTPIVSRADVQPLPEAPAAQPQEEAEEEESAQGRRTRARSAATTGGRRGGRRNRG